MLRRLINKYFFEQHQSPGVPFSVISLGRNRWWRDLSVDLASYASVCITNTGVHAGFRRSDRRSEVVKRKRLALKAS